MKRTALRIGSLLLILVLLLGVLPTAALADGTIQVTINADQTYYFLGDTFTVTATLPQDAQDNGTMEITTTTDATWLTPVGEEPTKVGDRVYTMTFMVNQIVGAYKTANFTATYKHGGDEGSVLTGAASYGFN